MNKLLRLFFFVALLFAACTAPEKPDLTSEFIVEEGFQIEAVAAEPFLNSLVEIEFDEKGRIWTLEMTGYMRDIDGSGEDIPDGKISILEDTDRDGMMDKKTVFLDELVLPRAIELVNGGLLYAEPPNLWWVPIENDQPGEHQLVDSMYSMGGNIEHAPNGLLYNLDNWIYSAKSDRRYQYRDGQWHVEATYKKGQWGITSDDQGRLYYNDNSNPIYGDFVMSNQVNANPYFASKNLERQNLSKSRRFYPARPTLVNRGYVEGVYDEEGRPKAFTSACSPLIYRGDQFRESYYNQAFVCGTAGNLVKRFDMTMENGKISALPTSEGTEFLTSTDPTFRPVNLNNGPDGALYVVDMRRAIIQHRAYMTSYLKEKIIEEGMDKLPLLGRIYRVTDSLNQAVPRPDLSQLPLAEWVPLLQSKNAWQRINAQKKLVFANDKSLLSNITKIAKDNQQYLGQISALWTLEGMGALTPELLNSLSEVHASVFQQIVVLAKTIIDESNATELLPIFEKAAASSNYQHHLQLAHSLIKVPEAQKSAMATPLIKKYADDPIISDALLSSLAGEELAVLTQLKSSQKGEPYLAEALETTLTNQAEDDKKLLVMSSADITDNRTRGFLLYNTYCGTCHGMDGKGMENLAPPLYQSEYVDGPAERLVLIMLNGLKGPITVHGEIYEGAAVMPGIKNNPDLTDERIKDILAYIKNGFTSQSVWFNMDTKVITDLRNQTADRQEMFTEEELMTWPIESEEEEASDD
ncbi:MAG: c-type cytochrome [Bacteroidota bacterium]